MSLADYPGINMIHNLLLVISCPTLHPIEIEVSPMPNTELIYDISSPNSTIEPLAHLALTPDPTVCDYLVDNCHLHEDITNAAYNTPWVTADYNYTGNSVLRIYPWKTTQSGTGLWSAGDRIKFHLHCTFMEDSMDKRLPTSFHLNFIDSCLNT